MVEQVCERSFKTKAQPLGNMKILGQPRGNRAGAGSFQDAHAAVSDRTRRNRTESVDIEHAAGHRDVAIADAIGPLQSSAKRNIEVSWIETGTGSWGQM